MQKMQETWVPSLGQEDPLEEETTTHSSILAWRIPWTEEPGGLQSMGSQTVDLARTHARTHRTSGEERPAMLWTSAGARPAATAVNSLPAPSCSGAEAEKLRSCCYHTQSDRWRSVTAPAYCLTAFGSILCLCVGVKWKHFRNPFLHLTPRRTVIFLWKPTGPQGLLCTGS